MDVILPLFVYGTVGLVAIYLCGSQTAPEERNAVVRLLVIAFALRLAMATVFSLFPGTRMFHEDADGYEWVGMRLAAAWSGQGPAVLRPREFNQGYFYLSGAAAFLVGGSRYAAAFLNTIFGTLTIFMVYRLTRRFFHTAVARRAAVCCAFFPSMILWSSIAIKDPVMSLLIVTALSGCIQLKQRFSVRALLLTILPVIACQPIRFYMIYFLGISIVASLLIERGARMLSGVPKMLLLGGGVIALLVLVGFAGRAQAGMEVISFQSVSNFRRGMATTANSGFDANVDVSTPGRAIAFMPVGVIMLLFSPFPWQFTSLRSTFALPEMLVWWSMVPSLWRGLRFVRRTRLADCSPILLFTITLTAGYSLMQGNVGSGFRQRAQIFIFLFIFSALGQFLKRCEQRGLSGLLLLETNPTPIGTTARS